MTPRGKVDNSVLVNRNLGATLHTLFLLGETTKEFLDLGDGLSRVEALGAGLRAVHDGVASVHGEGVPQLVQPSSLLLVPGGRIRLFRIVHSLFPTWNR